MTLPYNMAKQPQKEVLQDRVLGEVSLPQRGPALDSSRQHMKAECLGPLRCSQHPASLSLCAYLTYVDDFCQHTQLIMQRAQSHS